MIIVNMNQLYFMLMAFFVLQGCVQKRADSQDESLPYIIDIEECLEKHDGNIEDMMFVMGL